MRLAGPAITVRVPPGDVIVIESRGSVSVAQWGDITSMIARSRQLGGLVADGSPRDRKGICEAGFPVFALPVTTPNGALKDGPGEVNVPVAVGNVPILPGDIVVGDSNGVVVVPRRDAPQVLSRARQLAEHEAKKIQEIRSGHFQTPAPNRDGARADLSDSQWNE